MDQETQELPRKITPTLKRKITKDWHQCLPGLTLRKPMSLDRRVGPLLIGIGLQPESGAEYYAPGFSVQNLIRSMDFLAVTLGEPLRTTRTHAPDNLKVRWHNKFYQEAAERMNRQAWLPLEGPISLNDVITAYKSYVEKYNWPHQDIDLLEDPALIAAWAGEEQRAQEALEWGYQTLKTWNNLTIQKGETVSEARNADIWKVKMEKLMADPETLRQTAHEEAIKHKLTMIPYEDFTDTSYKESQK